MKHVLCAGSVLTALHKIHLLALTPTVLVRENRADKSLQPGWLKTAEIYSCTARKARSLKSGCQRGHALSQGSKKESPLASCSFGGLSATLGAPRLAGTPLPSLSLTPPRGVLPVHLSLSVSPLLIKTPVIALAVGAHPKPVSPRLNELHLRGAHFQIRSCSEVPRGRKCWRTVLNLVYPPTLLTWVIMSPQLRRTSRLSSLLKVAQLQSGKAGFEPERL